VAFVSEIEFLNNVLTWINFYHFRAVQVITTKISIYSVASLRTYNLGVGSTLSLPWFSFNTNDTHNFVNKVLVKKGTVSAHVKATHAEVERIIQASFGFNIDKAKAIFFGMP
jgi:hypothetical protein